MKNKKILLFNTIKYLKLTQIFFRVFYVARDQIRQYINFTYDLHIPSSTTKLTFKKSILFVNSFNNNTFKFLNKPHTFEETINWNFPSYGKLWTYNLTYFDYLNQEDISKKEGIEIINDFIDQSNHIKDGLEPFPISLRGINWIKFLVRHIINDQNINDSLYAQYQILMDNLEYHLLGNHLLENGFSLLFGAYYFQDEKLYTKAKKILTDELEEQVLKDGAHFELSPMYHQIMLFRALECINLVQNNSWNNQELLKLLISKAEIMLRWLNAITYENGDIPLLNDSANSIAPTTKQLNDYAGTLQITNYCQPVVSNYQLNESGYRKIKKKRYECIVDVGNIGPDYIPGHAHSDTFNFELYIDGKPFIVDTGLSTYETNKRRIVERSTVSHNTVQLEDLDQSEVWSGFRVANRAYIVNMEETDCLIEAMHDGYKKRLDALHQRKFLFENNKISIVDTIISKKSYSAIARLHFSPGIEPLIVEDGILVDKVKIKVQNTKLKLQGYNYAPEFNKLEKAKMLEIPFTKKLEIEIIL